LGRQTIWLGIEIGFGWVGETEAAALNLSQVLARGSCDLSIKLRLRHLRYSKRKSERCPTKGSVKITLPRIGAH